MRSLLFVPGDSERKQEKALGSGADLLILDLEDSVSVERKDEARRVTRAFLEANRCNVRTLFYVRVNDLATGMTDDDLAAVMPVAPHGIMLPKAQGGADVAQLSTQLRVAEAEAGLEDGVTRILPIITETAAALLAAGTYAGASQRLSALTWGAEDLSADIGARETRDADGRYTDVFRLARAATILAANAAQVAAIDTVFPNFRDMDAFRAECIEAERDGFTGRMAIHPAQVPVINEVFTPSSEAVAHARQVVETFAAAGNPGVVAIEGRMYDRPHLKRAERLIARAGAA